MPLSEDSSSAGFFFNKTEFVKRISFETIVSFPSNAKPVIHFSRTGNLMVSLLKSPFGGFIFSGETSVADLQTALHEAMQWSLRNNISNIVIKCFPEAYNTRESEMTQKILKDFNFNLLHKDIAQVIFTNDKLSFNTHRRRRLRNCIAKGFYFKDVPEEKIDAAYPLFERSRKAKGYPLTMTLDDFKSAFNQFPDDYKLFAVFDSEQMIAACVCIRVNALILYCFFIGDDIRYRKYSPVTMLIHGVHQYAMENRYEIIDLGISTDKGILNSGLYAFKKSLGAKDVSKNTYHLVL